MTTVKVDWNQVLFFFLCVILQFFILIVWVITNALGGMSGTEPQWYHSGWLALIIYWIFYLLLERMFKSKIPEKTMFLLSLPSLVVAIIIILL